MLNFVLRTVVKLHGQNISKCLLKAQTWRKSRKFCKNFIQNFPLETQNAVFTTVLKTFRQKFEQTTQNLHKNLWKVESQSKCSTSKVSLKILKAVREQWYIFLVESPKFSLKFEKVYEIRFFFKKSSNFTYSHAERCFDNNVGKSLEEGE